jgi:hypothetical protein
VLASSPLSVEEIALGVMTEHQLEQVLRVGLSASEYDLVARYLDGDLLARRTAQGLAQYRARRHAKKLLERHLSVFAIDQQRVIENGDDQR